MSYYVYGSKMSYPDYLTSKSFVSDVTAASRKAGRAVSMEISRQTLDVIASNEALARENIRATEASADRVVCALNEGFDRLSYGLDNISAGISELNAMFHWGFGEIIASLGHMNDSLTELIKIAKTPVQTVAFNHFEIARDAYRQGLYRECLDELEKAIAGDHTSAGYKLEWRFHQMKGMIRLGFADGDMALIDLAGAEESFLMAARYGKTDYPEDAGRAALSAGWAAYCQGKMKEALSHTEQAMALHPRMGEAFFQAAKVQMALGQVDSALPVLDKAIALDRFYALKAAGDGDFQKHDDRLRGFLEALRKEKYRQSVPKIKAALEKINVLRQYCPGAKSNPAISRMEAFIAKGATWPLLDMLAVVQNLDAIIAGMKALPIVVPIKGPDATRKREEKYPVQETYQEEVVIKPGGLFRKAITEFQTKTRTVMKTRIVKEKVMGPAVRMEFCPIHPGTFLMGEGNGEHKVTLTKEFYMGKYLVTQAQWQEIMGGNPSYHKGWNKPVEEVSWNDCQGFINKLNQRGGSFAYRLPTEAEWEYACRAGSTTKFCFGDDARLMRDYADSSGPDTQPVGQKKPNAWGLYDMYGNVWEWCQDFYGDYPDGPVTDPTGPRSGLEKVVRGDASLYEIQSSARRDKRKSDDRSWNVGFRLVCLQVTSSGK
ncbi:MAG: SUMF1/EgtB/PvdO family nonheme iron enzyme [Desulfosalsimonadaceae bacterium]